MRFLIRVKISRFARNDNRKTDHLNLNPGWIFAEKKKNKILVKKLLPCYNLHGVLGVMAEPAT